ncbi:hypothetical protein C3F00_034800, partial [Pseudomonas sp. MWU13-2860]
MSSPHAQPSFGLTVSRQLKLGFGALLLLLLSLIGAGLYGLEAYHRQLDDITQAHRFHARSSDPVYGQIHEMRIGYRSFLILSPRRANYASPERYLSAGGRYREL